MREALEEAKKAQEIDEVPIGAVLVDPKENKIVAAGGNRTRELNAIRPPMLKFCAFVNSAAGKRCNASPVTTSMSRSNPAPCAPQPFHLRVLEPCHNSVHLTQKVVAFLHGGKFFEQSTCHHKPEITHGVLMAEECGSILTEFFKNKREEKKDVNARN